MIKNAAVKRVNSNVPMVIVSLRQVSVMVNLNALINLTKEMLFAVSRSSHSTTIKDAAVKRVSGNVLTVIVLLLVKNVTARANVLMDLMKATRTVVSRHLITTTLKFVVVTQLVNWLVITANAS